MTRISKKKNSTSSQFSSSKPFLSTNPLMLLLEFQKVDFTSNIPRPVYTSQESPASSPKHSDDEWRTKTTCGNETTLWDR